MQAACPDPHDVNNRYAWSATGTAADGNAYTDFLANLNEAPGFAGHTDWRLPVISELQSIMVGEGVLVASGNVEPPDPAMGANATSQLTTCEGSPCVDPDFAALAGPTAASFYWSASSSAAFPSLAWLASFNNGSVVSFFKANDLFVRAVRVGECD